MTQEEAEELAADISRHFSGIKANAIKVSKHVVELTAQNGESIIVQSREDFDAAVFRMYMTTKIMKDIISDMKEEEECLVKN